MPHYNVLTASGCPRVIDLRIESDYVTNLGKHRYSINHSLKGNLGFKVITAVHNFGIGFKTGTDTAWIKAFLIEIVNSVLPHTRTEGGCLTVGLIHKNLDRVLLVRVAAAAVQHRVIYTRQHIQVGVVPQHFSRAARRAVRHCQMLNDGQRDSGVPERVELRAAENRCTVCCSPNTAW